VSYIVVLLVLIIYMFSILARVMFGNDSANLLDQPTHKRFPPAACDDAPSRPTSSYVPHTPC